MTINVAVNFDDAQKDLLAKIAASRAFWLAEGHGAVFRDHFPNAVYRFKAAGEFWGHECAEHRARLKALSGPILGLAIHDGRLFLATGAGPLELIGNEFVLRPMVVGHG